MLTFKIAHSKITYDNIDRNFETEIADTLYTDITENKIKFNINVRDLTASFKVNKNNLTSLGNYIKIEGNINNENIFNKDKTFWFILMEDEFNNVDNFTYTLKLDVIATFGNDIFPNLKNNLLKVNRVFYDRYAKDGNRWKLNVKSEGYYKNEFEISESSITDNFYNAPWNKDDIFSNDNYSNYDIATKMFKYAWILDKDEFKNKDALGGMRNALIAPLQAQFTELTENDKNEKIQHFNQNQIFASFAAPLPIASRSDDTTTSANEALKSFEFDYFFQDDTGNNPEKEKRIGWYFDTSYTSSTGTFTPVLYFSLVYRIPNPKLNMLPYEIKTELSDNELKNIVNSGTMENETLNGHMLSYRGNEVMFHQNPWITLNKTRYPFYNSIYTSTYFTMSDVVNEFKFNWDETTEEDTFRITTLYNLAYSTDNYNYFMSAKEQELATQRRAIEEQQAAKNSTGGLTFLASTAAIIYGLATANPGAIIAGVGGLSMASANLVNNNIASGTQKDLLSAQIQGESKKGSTYATGDATLAGIWSGNHNDVLIKTVSLKDEYNQKLINYHKMFSYEIETYKNWDNKFINSRESFDFIKAEGFYNLCVNSEIKLPQNILNEVGGLVEKGIRLWHVEPKPGEILNIKNYEKVFYE